MARGGVGEENGWRAPQPIRKPARDQLDLALCLRSLQVHSSIHWMCGHPRPPDKDDVETLGEK